MGFMLFHKMEKLPSKNKSLISTETSQLLLPLLDMDPLSFFMFSGLFLGRSCPILASMQPWSLVGGESRRKCSLDGPSADNDGLSIFSSIGFFSNRRLISIPNFQRNLCSLDPWPKSRWFIAVGLFGFRHGAFSRILGLFTLCRAITPPLLSCVVP